MIFLDANILMYATGRENRFREPSLRLLERIEKGKLSACTSTEVLQEILHRYKRMGARREAETFYNALVRLCDVVFPVELADTDRARDLLTEHQALSTRDAVHAAVMLNHGVKEIASYDTGFDAVTGIRRREPA